MAGADPAASRVRDGYSADELHLDWSGWWDSNPRRCPAPKAGGLAAGPHPVVDRLSDLSSLDTAAFPQ